jgi:zinc protease
MQGGGSRKDVETMFQLIYLRFTQPRPDPEIFSVQASQTKTVLANASASPEFVYAEAVASTMSQNHLRRRIMTAATVDQWNLDKSLAFYKDRFSDASGFTFVFVGSFDVAAMKPLVERYLGGLPATHRQETWKDTGVHPPTGVVEKTVEKGIEPKSQTVISFSGSFEYDSSHRTTLRAMGQILQMRLLETLREELGGTYSVSVNAVGAKIPRQEYQISIQFGSDPQRVDSLVKTVFEEIEKLKTGGPTDAQMSDEKEALLREFETSSKQNGYLLTQIAGRYQFGEDVTGIWDTPELYKKLDAPSIQAAAKTYLNANNYVRVTLVPEKK